MNPARVRVLAAALALATCCSSIARADDAVGADASTLRVTSVPLGALVLIDGQPVGHTPLEHALTPGEHALELELAGFQRRDERLQLAPGQLLELELRLAREAQIRKAEPAELEASPLDWVLGGALVLGAAPALWSGLATLADDGECIGAHDQAGRCDERVVFGTQSAVLLGVGAAALGVGVYVLLAQPFAIEVEAAPSAAALRVRLAL